MDNNDKIKITNISTYILNWLLGELSPLVLALCFFLAVLLSIFEYPLLLPADDSEVLLLLFTNLVGCTMMVVGIKQFYMLISNKINGRENE